MLKCSNPWYSLMINSGTSAMKVNLAGKPAGQTRKMQWQRSWITPVVPSLENACCQWITTKSLIPQGIPRFQLYYHCSSNGATGRNLSVVYAFLILPRARRKLWRRC